MHEKLPLLMKSEKLTSSRLAELLGIQPSGISHLLSGRNKPSYDLLQKILRRFPNINPDWLLLDDENMYRSENASKIESKLFADNETNVEIATTTPTETHDQNSAMKSEQRTGADVATILSGRKTEDQGRAVKRVILLYTDHSFESYEIK